MTEIHFRVVQFMDDIDDAWHLARKSDFNEHRDRVLQQFESDLGHSAAQSCVVRLFDGKCDGAAYGGRSLDMMMEEREEQRLGHMLLIFDGQKGIDGSWASSQYQQLGLCAAQPLYDTFMAKQCAILVTSCPGDVHGGVHSRMHDLVDGQGRSWRYCPVQFNDARAANWKFEWKYQVESFAYESVHDSNFVLDVKIDGGGAGCKDERSKNMGHWWVDWIKRSGNYIFDKLPHMGSEERVMNFAQVVVDEADFTAWANGSSCRLRIKGDMNMYRMAISPSRNMWCIISENYRIDHDSGVATKLDGNSYHYGFY